MNNMFYNKLEVIKFFLDFVFEMMDRWNPAASI